MIRRRWAHRIGGSHRLPPRHLLLAGPVVAAAVTAMISLGAATTEGSTPPDGELGAQLFANRCGDCHGADATGVVGRGPSLEHEGEASTDFVLRTGRMPLAAPNLQARRGPVQFTDAEIDALVGYVGALGDGPDIPEVDATLGEVSRGAEVYLLNCAACHVASGAGAAIGGGREAPNLLRATPTEIGKAILTGPGSMPVFDSLTAQDVDDVAAYIGDLRRQGTTSARRFGGAGPVAEGLAAFILGLIPLVALTRWIGHPKEGRDRPAESVADGEAT
jgi:ubiquinol-cytochrome c reductase cytochrome c subunit